MDLPFVPLSAVTVLAAAVVAVVAVLVWVRSARAYLVVVVIMLGVSRYSLNIGGFNLRADQLAVLLLAVPIFGITQDHRRGMGSSLRTLTALLMGYLVIGSLSRHVHGAALGETVRASLLMSVAVLAFWLPFLLVRRGLAVADMTVCTIAVGAVVGAFAVLLGAASYVSNSSLGVQRDPVDPSLHLAYVSFYEANLLGVFLAATLVLAVMHPLVSNWRPATRMLVPLAIGAGLLATLTRGSWIGLSAGLIVGGLTLRRGSPHRRRLWLKLGAVGLALVALVAVSPLRSSVSSRIADVLDLSTGSGFGRVRITNLAMAEWRTSRNIGRGFLSFKQLLPGSRVGATAWIPSQSVAILHDTGVVGAAAMLAFLSVLVRRLWKRAERCTAAAWIGVAMCLVVAGQATQPQVLPFFWFLLGLAAVSAEPEAAVVAADAGGQPMGPALSLASGRAA